MSDTRFQLDERFTRFTKQKKSKPVKKLDKEQSNVWEAAEEAEEVVFKIPNHNKAAKPTNKVEKATIKSTGKSTGKPSASLAKKTTQGGSIITRSKLGQEDELSAEEESDVITPETKTPTLKKKAVNKKSVQKPAKKEKAKKSKVIDSRFQLDDEDNANDHDNANDDDDLDLDNMDIEDRRLDDVEIAEDEKEEYEKLVRKELERIDKPKVEGLNIVNFNSAESKEKHEAFIAKERQKGICFLSSVSPYLNPKKVRTFLSQYGTILRIFLELEDPSITRRRRKANKKSSPRYVRGWIEFEDKRKAKRAAILLNGRSISYKRRSRLHADTWNIEYMSKMKWSDLSERHIHERRVRAQLVQKEMDDARQETERYLEQAKWSRSVLEAEDEGEDDARGEKDHHMGGISQKRKSAASSKKKFEQNRKRIRLFAQREAVQSDELDV